MHLDTGLRWREHINYLKSKTTQYMNILKWLSESSWGVGPIEIMYFINATISVQIEWGAM